MIVPDHILATGEEAKYATLDVSSFQFNNYKLLENIVRTCWNIYEMYTEAFQNYPHPQCFKLFDTPFFQKNNYYNVLSVHYYFKNISPLKILKNIPRH